MHKRYSIGVHLSNGGHASAGEFDTLPEAEGEIELLPSSFPNFTSAILWDWETGCDVKEVWASEFDKGDRARIQEF